jgi:hypothetical protein
MAKTYHLKCAICGGLLSTRGERVLKCKYCGERNLAIIPDWMPSYYFKPKLDLAGARRAMINLFKTPDVESGLIKTAHFESGELFFVPIYQLRARRVGTFVVMPRVESGGDRMYDQNGRPIRTSFLRSISEAQKIREGSPDTRVIINDVIRGLPAVKLEEWGLDELDPVQVLIEGKNEYQTYNREAMDKIATVLEPSVSVDERVDQIYKMTELIKQDQTSIVDKMVDLIYYPVWRVRWKYQGKQYLNTIDGITGKILFARAPAKQSSRVVWLLAISAAAGMSVGKVLSILKMVIITGFLSFWVLGIFSALLMFFVAFGWNMFRYSTELVIEGSYRGVDWIGRPPETIFEKWAKGMGDFAVNVLKSRRDANLRSGF